MGQTPPKKALLVIDVQRGLFDPEPRPFEADDVVRRINALAEKARAAGAPVVFIQHETPTDELPHGSERWALECGLVVKPGDAHLRKTTPDSFLRTGLGEMLAAWGTEEVVVCGYATDFCVDSTTRGAVSRGIPVTLAADAHTTHDKPYASAELIRTHHNAILGWTESFGPVITVVPAADIRF
ncbi:MAG: cysteine hydrolase family protein [Pseudomonadota bacterium]